MANFNLGNFGSQLSLGSGGASGGGMLPLVAPLIGSAVSGLFSGLAGGGGGGSAMASQQENPWWKFYQDLYPGMLTNALGALGDPTASRLMGNPENSKMFGEAYGSGSPLGYNVGRNPFGYSGEGSGAGMGGGMGNYGSGGFSPTMPTLQVPDQSQMGAGAPTLRPTGMFANGAYPITGKRDVRAV